MSYRKLSIDDVTDIIHRWRDEQSARRIARETGLDRKTVRRYLAAAASSSLPRDRAPTSEELAQIAHLVQTRPRPRRSDTWRQLLPYKDRIAAAIQGEKPLRLRSVHKSLLEESVSVTYWMLRRFALKLLDEQLTQPAPAAQAAPDPGAPRDPAPPPKVKARAKAAESA